MLPLREDNSAFASFYIHYKLRSGQQGIRKTEFTLRENLMHYDDN